MIIILSSSYDQTTNEVIDWLNFINVNYLRINKEDNILKIKIVLNNEEVDFEIVFEGYSNPL